MRGVLRKSIAQWSIEEYDAITSRVAKGKGKGKTRGKKLQNALWGNTTNRQKTLKITILGDC